VPVVPARPGRRLLRVAGVGMAGIAVGVGVTLAAHGLGGGADRAASVQRLDLPAGVAASAAPAAEAPGDAEASAPSRSGGPAARAAAGGSPPTRSRSGPTCPATAAPPRR
jgi:hypothetical protein